MSDDERALLAAIIAQPADDTVRLVYADWLDEHGHAPRAEFIRVQVEAERLHQDSLQRAKLIGQAEELFAANWLDWWAPVCEAVGLPAPQRARATRLGRFAQRYGLTRQEGRPYERRRFTVGVSSSEVTSWERVFDQFVLCEAEFRRGFPGSLVPFNSLGADPRTDDLLSRWASVAPLDRLDTSHSVWQAVDGPHLVPLPSLTVPYEGLVSIVASPHLTGLTEFRWNMDPDEHLPDAAQEIGRIASAPFARQLRRLAVPVRDDEAARVLAGAAAFAGLTSLTVALNFETDTYSGPVGLPDNDRSRLEILAGSPHFAGLEELDVVAALTPAGVRAVVCGPTWSGLRKLTLRPEWQGDCLDPLAEATLPELVELRVEGYALSPVDLRAVARALVLRQLRHLCLSPHHQAHAEDIRAIADALDADRIETLSFSFAPLPPGSKGELRRRFGDRVRL